MNLKHLGEWYETGMAGQGQVSQEITSALDTLGRQNQRFAGSFNPFKTDFKGLRLFVDVTKMLNLCCVALWLTTR